VSKHKGLLQSTMFPSLLPAESLICFTGLSSCPFLSTDASSRP
jgi:hypothetical protein